MINTVSVSGVGQASWDWVNSDRMDKHESGFLISVFLLGLVFFFFLIRVYVARAGHELRFCLLIRVSVAQAGQELST